MEAAIRHGSPLSINIPSSGSLMNCHLNKTGNRFLLLAGSGIDVVSSAPATYTALPEVGVCVRACACVCGGGGGGGGCGGACACVNLSYSTGNLYQLSSTM